MDPHRGTAVTVATGAASLIYALSTLMKLKGLITGSGHPAFGGASSPYPGWFLPVAVVHEACTVALFLAGEESAACVASSIFLGGVAFTNLNPWFGMAYMRGPKTLIPLAVVGSATGFIASAKGILSRSEPSPAAVVEMVQAANVRRLLESVRRPALWMLGAGMCVGVLTGLVLHQLKSESAAAQKRH